MRVALPDVNVLIALFDPNHPNHEMAHGWFSRQRRQGWSTCPITINGCIRVLSNPAYPSFDTTASEVISRLRALCASADHHFWAKSVSLLDDGLFRATAVMGHQRITDTYLLGLVVQHNGTLATFDRSISLKAVVGARSEHLQLLGAEPDGNGR
jgi:toxin-antitoxin system PIN domain toxin